MNSLYGNFRTRKFTDIFPTYDSFYVAYRGSELNLAAFSDASLVKLYYLLYASYGNSSISNADENQFRYRLYTIIFSKGLQWQKSLEIQDTLVKLSDEEILTRAKYVSSHAYNPGEYGTNEAGELTYINEQSVNRQSGSPVDTFNAYLDSLKDVSTAFIAEFGRLFLKIVYPEEPLWYAEEDTYDL